MGVLIIYAAGEYRRSMQDLRFGIKEKKKNPFKSHKIKNKGNIQKNVFIYWFYGKKVTYDFY